MGRRDIQDLGRADLAAWCAAAGEPGYRVEQILAWVHRRGARRFEDMTNLPRGLRARLAAEFTLGQLAPAAVVAAADGTRKLLFHLSGGAAIESVLIPRGGRLTLCISSQAGCGMGCAFCATARMGLVRNLRPGEIVGQVRAGRQVAAPEPVTNIVLMGMGEPLANYRNVLPALSIFMHDLGFDLSRRRVTLSTSGLVPQIYRLAEDTNCALAVSLHAPNDRLRNELVPINRKHPIAELLAACWHYLDAQNGRSITFEYVMLDGVNDRPEHARELAALLRGHDAKVNLIPFNPFPGTAYRRSAAPAIAWFRDYLNGQGVTATVRKTRGDDIDAACGQLAGRVQDRTLVRLGRKLIPLEVQP
jgi:23S rRNA (adenine2503-C2)-methyltransferase